MADLTFTASPIGAKFMNSSAFGRIIVGPVGSGKTTDCVIELLRRSIEQRPAPDGTRYTRFAVVRQTLRQLKDTVLKDCETWLSDMGTWKVSESTFHLNFNDIRSEWVFIPLEDAEDQARLLSMQLTGAWLSEAIEMNLDVIGPISGQTWTLPFWETRDTDVVWACGRYEYAHGNDPMAYVHGELAPELAAIQAAIWTNLALLQLVWPANQWCGELKSSCADGGDGKFTYKLTCTFSPREKIL